MKSKERLITIMKARQLGIIPTYINLAQRHLEKEVPMGETSGLVTVYMVPVDLLRVTGLIPSDMIDHIDSLTLAYSRKGEGV